MQFLGPALEILQTHWGYHDFRDPQDKIIDQVLNGKDVFALLPTGAGKSLCFQVPGLLFPGITLVVSPLLALMRDQVDGLNRREISATAINSLMNWNKIEQKLTEAEQGKYKFIYVAPERIQSELFAERISRMNISLVAIDEAHCVSQWGYDFRPAYLQIAHLRNLKPGVPFIALTASATPKVQNDIAEKLALKNPEWFVKSFRRANISLSAEETENVTGKIVESLREAGQSVIVYARTRRRTENFSAILERYKIGSAPYHGGMEPQIREKVQQEWVEGKTKVMVATNAFGMGIDKPDVRQVHHFNLPTDLESYYQEAGRAGRDGNPALAKAYFNPKEFSELNRWVEEKYPPLEIIRETYYAICAFFQVPEGSCPDEVFAVDLNEVAKRFEIPFMLFFNSLRILHNENIIAYDESEDHFGHIRFIASPEQVLNYKEEQPVMASTVNFLLRNLSGEVWHEEVGFNPYRWQKRLGFSESELNQKLAQLVSRKLLSYRPATKLPSIRLVVPRKNLTPESLNWEKYSFLRIQALERLQSLLQYVLNPENQCRALLIEIYFGETGGMPCGICDVCRLKTHGMTEQRIMEILSREIEELLSKGPMEVNSILSRLDLGSKTQKQQLIRQMVDKKMLRFVDGFLVLPPS